MNQAIANVFGYVLNFIYNIVNNYGLAVILFSVFLKLIMLPITIIQQKSQSKSTKVQEEAKKLQVKYGNNPEMLNKATMELYKREHFNPMSGCLITILQFIIFISIFYLISRPLTYMRKVDSEVITSYQNQLVEQGETMSNYPEIQIIETFGSNDDRVNLNMNFLGLNLSNVPISNKTNLYVFIIPGLYVAFTFINIKYTNDKMKKAKEKKKVNEDKKEEKVIETNSEEIKNEEKNEDIKEEKVKKSSKNNNKAKSNNSTSSKKNKSSKSKTKEMNFAKKSDKLKVEIENKNEKDDSDEKIISVEKTVEGDKEIEITTTEREEEKKKEHEEASEEMQKMSSQMSFLMPLMSISIALIAPLGLSLYWLTNGVLQFIERIIIDSIMERKMKKQK